LRLQGLLLLLRRHLRDAGVRLAERRARDQGDRQHQEFALCFHKLSCRWFVLTGSEYGWRAGRVVTARCRNGDRMVKCAPSEGESCKSSSVRSRQEPAFAFHLRNAPELRPRAGAVTARDG